jgi:hypothetical protein
MKSLHETVAVRVLSLAALLALSIIGSPALAASHLNSSDYQPNAQVQEATVTIDNVTVTIRTPFMPTPTFTVSTPGDEPQGATAVSLLNPFGSLDVLAIPFGTLPPGISVPDNPFPLFQHGNVAAMRAKLREYKAIDGGTAQPGPTSTLFGQKVQSDETFLQLELNTSSKHPTLFVEWVVEAGPRIWIVRIVKQLPDGTTDLTSQAAFLQSLESLTLSSTTLDNPSTLKPAFGFGTPTPTPLGMPPTGAASAEDGLADPLALAALIGGLLLLGGVALRSGGGFRKVR